MSPWTIIAWCLAVIAVLVTAGILVTISLFLYITLSASKEMDDADES